MSDLCLVAADGPTATITLNRPAARNALNLELLTALIAQLEGSAGADVLVLQGAGPAFCAGADVRSDDGTAIGRPGLRRELIERAIALVRSFPVAVAVVDGPAVGGGWGLAFAADVVLATENARFAFPELALGFLPPPSIVARFRQLAGPARAVRLLGTGERFAADDPALHGLVEVVPAAQLAARVTELTGLFARAAPGLLRSLAHGIDPATTPEGRPS